MTDPGYWMYETSGVLRPAVEAYIRREPLGAEQIAAMRGYLRQWIGAEVWDHNPHATKDEREWLAYMRLRIDELTTRCAVDDWIEDAVGMGMDPL